MDDLTRIPGIGRATADRLAAEGFDTFEKLAHDGLAGQHGIKVEWIAEAAKLLRENTEEKPPRSDDRPEDQSRDRADLPADGGAGDPQFTNSTDTPPSEDQGGAGNLAGPAGGWDEFMRGGFPRLQALTEAWFADHKERPAAVRITCAREGFRRAGLTHPKGATEYSTEKFGPDELEQMLAEPKLTVELV